MIQGTIIKGDTISLVLTGTDDIDIEVLKALSGATVKVINDNLKIGEKLITGGLIIQHEGKIKELVANPGEGISEGLHGDNREESGPGREPLP